MALDPSKYDQLKDALEVIIEEDPTDEKKAEAVIEAVIDRLGFAEELIDESRPPRLYVFGRAGAGKSSLINALSNKQVAPVGDIEPTTEESQLYEIPFTERYASWEVVDSRGLFETVSPEGDVPADTISIMKQDLKEYRPDLLIHVMTPDQVRAGKEDFEAIKEMKSELGSLFSPVVYCLNKVDTHMAPNDDWPPEENPSLAGDIKRNIDFVSDVLNQDDRSPFRENQPLYGYEFDSEEYIGITPTHLKDSDYWNVETLSWLIGDFLPSDARLQFYQAQRRDDLMQQVARTRTNQAALTAGGIGATPLPVADFPVLTGIQLVLVAFIGALSCRDFAWSTVEDYLSAMGATAIAGTAGRGLARSLIQIVPGAGTAVSAAVAGSTTWAVGRSAEEYFFNDNIKKPSGFMKKNRKVPRKIEINTSCFYNICLNLTF